MSRPRPSAGTATLLVLLALLALLGSAPTEAAAAAAATQDAGGGAVRFVGQTQWVPRDGQFSLRVNVVRPAGPSDLELVVNVFQAVAFRSEFQETLADQIYGDLELPEAAFPLGALAAEANGDYQVTVPAPLGAVDGVYPVRVELRSREDFDILDGFVTHLVYLGGEHTGDKLGVSLVLPVHRAPSLQPDGTRSRPGESELSNLSLGIEAAGALPVSFVPTPETVASLVASNDPQARTVLTALRQAVAKGSLIGGTYVPVSLPALTTAGLDGEVAGQLERGGATLTEVLRAKPVSDTWVAEEPLDSASVDLLANRRITRIVATEAGLTPIPDQLLTLTAPFQLDGEESAVEGVVADAGLSAHFEGDNPALQAAHFLADLAVLYLDEPGERRGVVALAPRTWQLDRVFLDSIASGLRGNPVVEPVTLDAVFDNVPPATDLGDPLIRRPAVDPGGSLTGVVDRIRGVRGRLSSLGSVLGPTNAVSSELDQRLLVAQSADFRSARQRDGYLTGVQRAIDEQLGGIDMPQDRSITLTARRGEIPVTFQNHTGHPVKVIVRMESDKLDFPRGETLEIDLTRLNTTHRFPVVARTSGTFPIRITLESPDGRLVVGRARLTVRSTAASGVGLAISLASLLFLALWWGRHAQRGRRAKQLVEPPTVPAPDSPAAPPPGPPVRAPSPQPVGQAPAVPVPAESAGATFLAVPMTPDPPAAAAEPAPLPPREDVTESPPVATPGTLGGG